MRPVVLVAGASSSLGRVLCRQLVAAGYKVYAGYRGHPERLEPSEALVPLALDLTSDASCEAAVAAVLQAEGALQAVVNLVALSSTGPGLERSVADFQALLDTNAVGAFRLMKAALPRLPEGGRVIHVGSLSGLISFPRFSLYSASKFALRALVLSLHYEWLPQQRFVTCLSPGAIAKDPPEPPPPGSARGRIPLLNWLLPLTTPQAVGRAIVGCLAARRPRAEILVGRDVRLLVLVQRLLPQACWHALQSRVWKRQQ